MMTLNSFLTLFIGLLTTIKTVKSANLNCTKRTLSNTTSISQNFFAANQLSNGNIFILTSDRIYTHTVPEAAKNMTKKRRLQESAGTFYLTILDKDANFIQRPTSIGAIDDFCAFESGCLCNYYWSKIMVSSDDTVSVLAYCWQQCDYPADQLFQIFLTKIFDKDGNVLQDWFIQVKWYYETYQFLYMPIAAEQISSDRYAISFRNNDNESPNYNTLQYMIYDISTGNQIGGTFTVSPKGTSGALCYNQASDTNEFTNVYYGPTIEQIDVNGNNVSAPTSIKLSGYFNNGYDVNPIACTYISDGKILNSYQKGYDDLQCQIFDYQNGEFTQTSDTNCVSMPYDIFGQLVTRVAENQFALCTQDVTDIGSGPCKCIVYEVDSSNSINTLIKEQTIWTCGGNNLMCYWWASSLGTERFINANVYGYYYDNYNEFAINTDVYICQLG